MADIIKIEDFYTSLKETIYDNVINQGHFNIINVRDLPTGEGKPASYLRQSYYKVSLVYGQSKIHYPGEHFEIKGAALVFTNPKTPYNWERISTEQEGYVCIFTKDFLCSLANPDDFVNYQSANFSVIQLDELTALKLKNTFKDMIGELKGIYRFKYDLLRLLLLEILHIGQKHIPYTVHQLTESNANERIGIIFLKHLERQFPIDNSIQQVHLTSPGAFAKIMNIHVNHLNKVLRKITGNTTSTLINNRFMLEAKNLLIGTKWTINEISWVLGFDEPQHFSAFFKRHSGMNPNKFRTKID